MRRLEVSLDGLSLLIVVRYPKEKLFSEFGQLRKNQQRCVDSVKSDGFHTGRMAGVVSGGPDLLQERRPVRLEGVAQLMRHLSCILIEEAIHGIQNNLKTPII